MDNEVKVVDVDSSPTAVIRGHTDQAGIPDTIIGSLNRVYAALEGTGAVQQGQNIVLYGPHGPTFDVEVGIQVDRPFTGSPGGIESSSLPAGRAARALHVGPYHLLHHAHAAVMSHCKAEGLELSGPNWEVYGDWDDDESKLETEVFYLLR